MAKSKTVKSYSVGELISKELPLVHVCDIQQKGVLCDNCLTTNKSLKKCAKCLRVFYCNQQCQKSDWFWHKNECKVFTNNSNKCFDDFVLRILMRLWLKVVKSEQILHKSYKVVNGLNRCLIDLESHESEIRCDSNRMKEFNEFCDLLTDCGLTYDKKKLLQLYGQIIINCFSIVVHDLTYSNVRSGYGLYVCSSVFDHSCAPNAGIVFDGTNLMIRATKPIGVGEEVFIHYISLDNSRSERMLQLQNQYYFQCNCLKCCTEDGISVDYKRFKELIKSFHSIISDDSTKSTFDSMSELLLLSDQIYGPIHPEMAAILMTAMQFQLLTPDSNLSSEELSAFIERVGRVIELSFGPDHKFFKMYKLFAAMKNII